MNYFSKEYSKLLIDLGIDIENKEIQDKVMALIDYTSKGIVAEAIYMIMDLADMNYDQLGELLERLEK